MSEQGMVLGEVNKGINKTSSSVKSYESAWLGRWSQLGNEVKYNAESSCCKDNVKERNSSEEVIPFPMFKVSQKRESTTTTTSKLQAFPVSESKPSFHENVGSSSNKPMANRMPWMYAQGDNRFDIPIQEKTTQNLLELIRPVRIYATVDSVSEEDDHQLLKGSMVSMKLKGKVFSGYLDLFPNIDHSREGGVRLQSLETSKDIGDDGPRPNDSSAETDTGEIDRLQTIHLSGSSISSSTAKGKGRQGDSAIPRTEIPDMNEEPERENSVDELQGETSNSATQSMNVDHFVSRECKRVRLEQETEPSSRWVKRLKTNALSSSGHHENKSLMKIEDGQKGNNNNLFLEILKSGINNLQPRNQEPSAATSDITLLHPWIQRWCKKKTTCTSSTDQQEGQEGRCEPENQKELEKKQYPSIAAMALMGKALTGLNPYCLRKTDNLMVWNARDLR